ncbi:flagellar basal body P-ring formation protein FlgA, partial [bacterium]|nr:flagellar basal body P-ring formation protein FlgA [bacterium]
SIEKSEMIDAVTDYYLSEMDIEKDQLNLRIAHFPNTQRLPEDEYELEIERNQIHIKLGYQTIRLLVKKDNLIVKRYPLSVEVSVYKNVCVTRKKVSRNTAVSRQNLEIKRVLLSRNTEGILFSLDAGEDRVYARPISAGRIVRSSDLKVERDVKYGDKVKIRISSGPLVLLADGKILEEASVGGKVKVYINQSAKKKIGILLTPGLVEIQM